MKRPLVMIAALALLLPLLTALQPAERAEAANAALFDPGNIISDANMYDGGVLTGAQVQDFLQQRVASCTPGYTCLRDYRQNTPTMAPSALCPGGYAGAANERGADIIAKVGAACNISQKVLLVLLEKEQSLVTMRNPSSTRFDRATGFSCPDTAPCDPSFAGFFYQVYYAARQFQNYAKNPTSWNYQPGRVNSILFNPNAGCGRANVFIQNKATAGLYIYTPYQPNASALANLYGTGDSCASYGNRNFWRIFTDWFGNPAVASSLLRTADNATVFLVAGEKKYPIGDSAIFGALAPLGPVVYVSQRYLDAYSTAQLVGRSIRDPGGSIYFFDAGIKLAFTSCTQAADYGASCDADGYVQLTQEQADRFSTGPLLTSVTATTEGARYYVSQGTKAEILDDASQQQAGIPLGMNVLTERALSHLPLAAPIVRDDVFALSRGTSQYALLSQSTAYAVRGGDAQAVGVTTRTAGTLWPASVAKLTAGPDFSGLVVAEGTTSLLGADGQYAVADGAVPRTMTAIPVSAAFVASYVDKGRLALGSFIKSPSKADIYVVTATDVRPISSWNALLSLSPGGSPSFTTVPQTYISDLRFGPVALTAGALVRSPENATVYYINGITSKIALSSFDYPSAAGVTGLLFVDEAVLRDYPLDPTLMSFGFICDGAKYIAGGGSIHAVPAELEALYAFGYVTLDRYSCARLTVGAPATQFIRTPDGSIYLLEAGTKRPIGSYARFLELASGAGFTNVPARFASEYATGPLA